MGRTDCASQYPSSREASRTTGRVTIIDRSRALGPKTTELNDARRAVPPPVPRCRRPAAPHSGAVRRTRPACRCRTGAPGAGYEADRSSARRRETEACGPCPRRRAAARRAPR
jgi:hypothetical protein